MARDVIRIVQYTNHHMNFVIAAPLSIVERLVNATTEFVGSGKQ
ncbi:hypothetical protein [Mycetohabitans sp. B46]